MTKHIDTLNEWYENAEQITRENMPRDGDTIMYPRAGGAYTIEPATYGWVESIVHPDDDVRILHRAPKPEPAWHDAVAVIASTEGDDIRRGFVPVYDIETGEERTGEWSDWVGEYPADELYDPVPLIEQKVTTSAMRAVDAMLARHGMPTSEATATAVTRAALGLDPA